MRAATSSALCAIGLTLAACGAPPATCPPTTAAVVTAPPAAPVAPATDTPVSPPKCGPLAPGVDIEPSPLVDGMPAYRARRAAEELVAVCGNGAWHLVPLEERQLDDSDGFEVTITSAEAVDRTGDGEQELEVAFRFTESLTELPPAGPYRRAEGVVLLSVSSPAPRELLRFYLRGETDTAVAYGESQMVGAAQWVATAEGPILSIVQSVATTEDGVAPDDAEHGAPVTSVEVFNAVSERDDAAFKLDQGALWRPLIPGL